MADIVLETIRVLIVAFIFYLFYSSGRDKDIRQQQGWLYIVVGFGLILFATAVDITDNFPSLNKYIIIGDTVYQAFLEKVIGFLGGFFLLAIGLWKWIPVVITLRKTEKSLKKVHDFLELKVNERTAQLEEEIQERKQTENKLQKSETNFRTFFNSIDDFLFVLDEQGNMVNVNETVIQRLEYSEDDLIGRNVMMVHPEDRQAEAGRIVGKMIAGTADFCPVPLVTKSGQHIQVETRVYPGFWNDKPALFGVTKDITRIKKTEELFSKAFHAGSCLMAISEIESELFINVNKTFLDTLGYTLEDVIGKSSIELGIFDNPEERNRVLSMVKESGFAKNMEVKIRVKKGEPRIGLFSVSQIDISDKPCWLTTMTDITERKQMETSLRENQARLDLALQSAEMGAWQWDIIENKRYFDSKVCSLLGIDPENFNGTAEEFFSVVHPDDREMLKNTLDRTIDQDSLYKPEYRTVWPDGSIHYLSAHGKLVRDDSGRAVKINGIIGDITKSKLAQQNFENERQRLANVIRGTNTGTWEWNVQTGETVFNEKWAEIIGYKLEELAPVSITTWTSFTHPEDLQKSGKLLKKHFSGELPYYDCQCRMKHKNGHWVWVYDRGQVITWTDDGKPLMMFGTQIDIHEKKMTEKKLGEYRHSLEKKVRSRTKELEKAHRALVDKALEAGRSQLSAMIFHNIGNAVTPISIYAKNLQNSEMKELNQYLRQCYEEMLNHKDNLTEYIARDLRGTDVLALMGEVISSLAKGQRKALDTMGKIISGIDYISEILTLQRSYAPGNNEIKENVNLSSLAKDALKMQEGALVKRNIDINVSLPQHMPTLKIEKSKLMQVMVNLIKNSCDAIEECSVDCQNNIFIETYHKDGRTGFRIKDTGIGIEKYRFEEIFEFGISSKGSSGFGLYYCKNFVKANNGSIFLDSPGKGQGATITIEFRTTNENETQ